MYEQFKKYLDDIERLIDANDRRNFTVLAKIHDIRRELGSYGGMSIYELGLRHNVASLLKGMNVDTVGQLLKFNSADLLRRPGFGKHSLLHLIYELDAHKIPHNFKL
jgi:DNA-directed RNA polymerase alpha subunit